MRDDGDILRVGGCVPGKVLGRDDVDSDTAELACCAGEVLVDERLAETNCLKGLRPRIGGDRRDPHLGHGLE